MHCVALIFINIYYNFLQARGKNKANLDAAIINCQYSMAVFSTSERKRRPRGDRKSQELSNHLRQALSASIKTELYPKTQIDIFIEVSALGSFAKPASIAQ